VIRWREFARCHCQKERTDGRCWRPCRLGSAHLWRPCSSPSPAGTWPDPRAAPRRAARPRGRGEPALPLLALARLPQPLRTAPREAARLPGRRRSDRALPTSVPLRPPAATPREELGQAGCPASNARQLARPACGGRKLLDQMSGPLQPRRSRACSVSTSGLPSGAGRLSCSGKEGEDPSQTPGLRGVDLEEEPRGESRCLREV
jgi:hypothetical protein